MAANSLASMPPCNRRKNSSSDGADIIDVGAESTRPGHTPVAAEEELARLEPILGKLTQSIDIPFSIDTSKAKVARARDRTRRQRHQ